MTWVLMRGWRARCGLRPLPLGGVLLTAAASHEVLDFLVGVHPSPWLWPFDKHTFRAPLGVLLSAGRLDFGNRYLWRNLLIEMGVLGPALLTLCAARRRDVQMPKLAWAGLWTAAVVALIASLTLRR